MRIVRNIVIAVLVLGAVALLAFGPRAGDELPKDRVIVEYWEKWTGKEGEALHALVDEFNKTEGVSKGIYVNCLTTSEIGKKTLIATAAGKPPDIAGLWDYNLVQYAALDAIEPLEAMAKAKGIDEAYYKPVYWRTCNWDGHLYALVSTPATAALHYNKRIFQENAGALRAAGLDPNRATETLDEFDRYAIVLDKRDANGRLIRAGHNPLEPISFLRQISLWFGKTIWNDETQQFQMTDPEVVKAFAWVQGYTRRLGKEATQDFRSQTSASPQNAFFIGRVVMEQQGPWLANFIRNQAPQMTGMKGLTLEQELDLPLAERRERSDWAAAPFPSAVAGMKDVTYATDDLLVIPKGAKHKAEAFEFMVWLNRRENMERLCMAHCKNSPLATMSDTFISRHSNPYIEVFERLAKSPNAVTTPHVPIYQEVADEMDWVIQTVALGGEPEATLAEAQKRLQKKYDYFMEIQRARKALAVK